MVRLHPHRRPPSKFCTQPQTKNPRTMFAGFLLMFLRKLRLSAAIWIPAFGASVALCRSDLITAIIGANKKFIHLRMPDGLT